MSKRYEAIGGYVYENGNRIGVSHDESACMLAKKLNAYRSRITRLKSANRLMRKAGDHLANCLWPEIPQAVYDVIKWEDAKSK
jgi:hypothetical protein